MSNQSSYTDPILKVRDLKKYFPVAGGRFLRAVDGVSLELGKNEILGIVGESGCGKSTLGRLILRLIDPTAGQLFFKGEEISPKGRMRPFGPRAQGSRLYDAASGGLCMQMVFQNPFASFNPRIRIAGALMEVCRYYGMSREQGQERIASLFKDTGLSEELLGRWPRELSGGQLQRLAITRALLSEPDLIVADEPLSALDVSVQAQLLNLLEGLRKNHDMSMLFISHDMTVVEYLCDRVAVMYLGRIVETAPAAELFRRTLHPYTCSLIAAVPQLDRVGERRPLLKGEIPNPSEKIEGGSGPDGSPGTTSSPGTASCPFAPRCPEAVLRCRFESPAIQELTPGHLVSCHQI
jgi:ABC-type oligopeptide transport system ATPase subunit